MLAIMSLLLQRDSFAIAFFLRLLGIFTGFVILAYSSHVISTKLAELAAGGILGQSASVKSTSY